MKTGSTPNWILVNVKDQQEAAARRDLGQEAAARRDLGLPRKLHQQRTVDCNLGFPRTAALSRLKLFLSGREGSVMRQKRGRACWYPPACG